MCRQHTDEEMIDRFLSACESTLEYWLREERAPTVREKMEGMLFSLLVMFDGCTDNTPALDILPSPHPSDKEYCQENEENWWPQLPEDYQDREDFRPINANVSLHDLLCKRRQKRS